MSTSSCLNENPLRILIRIENSADLTTRKILGNVVEGELIYIKDTNELYVCTQSTNGATNGVVTKVSP